MAVRILVIDDERVVHTYLKGVFEPHGHRVSSALDAVQGVMMARQLKPELIVLDVNMPGGGGYEVLKRVRMSAHTTHIPVLLYTVLDSVEIEPHVQPAPDVRYLRKPASPDDLLATARLLLPGV